MDKTDKTTWSDWVLMNNLKWYEDNYYPSYDTEMKAINDEMRRRGWRRVGSTHNWVKD